MKSSHRLETDSGRGLDFSAILIISTGMIAAWSAINIVFSLVAYFDLIRQGHDATVIGIFRIHLLSTWPYLFSQTAMAVTGFEARIMRRGWPAFAIRYGAVLAAAMALNIVNILFVFAPLLGVSPSDILNGIPLLDWVISLVILSMSGWAGQLYAGHRMNRPTTRSGAKVFHARSASRVDIVPIDKILFVSAQGNYVTLHTADRDVLHRSTLTEMAAELANMRFVHIHRSHLVRLDQIASVKRKHGRIHDLILISGQTLPVSERGASLLEDALVEE